MNSKTHAGITMLSHFSKCHECRLRIMAVIGAFHTPAQAMREADARKRAQRARIAGLDEIQKQKVV